MAALQPKSGGYHQGHGRELRRTTVDPESDKHDRPIQATIRAYFSAGSGKHPHASLFTNAVKQGPATGQVFGVTDPHDRSVLWFFVHFYLLPHLSQIGWHCTS